LYANCILQSLIPFVSCWRPLLKSYQRYPNISIVVVLHLAYHIFFLFLELSVAISFFLFHLFNFDYFEASCSYYTIHSFHSYSCSLLVLVVHSRYIINFLCSFLGLYQGWLTNWYSNRELNDLLSELWFKSYYVMDKREPLIWSLILKVYLTCSSRFLILEFMRGIFCIANINSLVR
jgi:hypothetical protein